MNNDYTCWDLDADLKETINELKIFRNCDNKMWHYTTLAGMKGILDSETIHLSRIDVLNDKTEVLYLHNIMGEALEYYMKMFKEGDEAIFLEELQDVIEHNKKGLFGSILPYGRKNGDSYLHTNEIYICSFSGENDSLDMWKHYSKGNGVGIGFDIGTSYGMYEKIDRQSIETDKYISVKVNKYVGKVVYDAEEQVQIVKKLLKKGLETYKKFCTENDYKQILKMLWASEFYNSVIFPVALFMKHPSFSSEDESRIVITKKYTMGEESDWNNLAFVGEYMNKYKLVDGVLKPYIEMKISKENIRQVFLSPITKCDSRILLEYLKSKKLQVDESNVVKSTIPLRF